MTQRFREQIPQIVAGFDWSRFSSIVDVGGGHGTLLAAILDVNPELTGHLIDLSPPPSRPPAPSAPAGSTIEHK